MEPTFGMVDTEFSVELHPSGLRDVSRSVKQILNAQVLTYNKEYCGVVMAYKDARVLSSTAPVHTFFPYSHVKVSAKLLILQLAENQDIDGTVDQVGMDYIGLKVFGGLVAVIHEDELQRKFAYSHMAGGWLSKADPTEVITAGSSVRFSLKRVDTSQGKFIIVGSTDRDDVVNAASIQPSIDQQRHVRNGAGGSGAAERPSSHNAASAATQSVAADKAKGHKKRKVGDRANKPVDDSHVHTALDESVDATKNAPSKQPKKRQEELPECENGGAANEQGAGKRRKKSGEKQQAGEGSDATKRAQAVEATGSGAEGDVQRSKTGGKQQGGGTEADPHTPGGASGDADLHVEGKGCKTKKKKRKSSHLAEPGSTDAGARVREGPAEHQQTAPERSKPSKSRRRKSSGGVGEGECVKSDVEVAVDGLDAAASSKWAKKHQDKKGKKSKEKKARDGSKDAV